MALKSTSQLDEEVFAAVLKTKEEGRQVVHMDQSKLGYQSSDDLIKKTQQT
jgi:hypothetical protein